MTQTILVVQAHPDDADISSGASVARWCREGADVVYATCTSGEAGRSEPQLPPAELGLLREEEERAAAAVLGVTDVRYLRFPDSGLHPEPALVQRLTQLILELQPQRLVTHDPWAEGEHHPDHLSAGVAAHLATVEAAVAGHRIPEVYLFRTDTPNTAVEVTATLDLKLTAMEEHRTQRSIGEAPASAIRSWAVAAGERWGVPRAELFRVLGYEEFANERPPEEERL